MQVKQSEPVQDIGLCGAVLYSKLCNQELICRLDTIHLIAFDILSMSAYPNAF